MSDQAAERRVYIKQTTRAVAQDAAEAFVRLTRQAASVGAPFRVALSGGSTPKLLYNILVSDAFRNEVPWDAVDFFFGDERWVPQDDPASNYKLANDELFLPLNISRTNIHPIPTENVSTEESARRYEDTIRQVFDLRQDDVPRFDLIFLGMGDEGHTASLFPHTAVLHDNEHLVAPTYVEKLSANRITLTPLTLNAAANVIFMVGGGGKAEALTQVLEGEYNPDEYPSQLLSNSLGSVTWLVDKDAASALEGEYPEA
ncbi:MAG: 6-phosphogluconolactonase [Chloroflexota bacterium]